ncbi:MAG TPA: hypothetical protein VK387_07325 [Thermoleophilaceae bacterium]|nr:hypothetical protein [Thermoleophilaceae bacterium]
MNGPQPLPILVGLRFAIGLGAWLVPRASGRAFGLDPRRNPQVPYVGRLFGARDVALGAGVMASEGEARALWLRLGFACDVADAAAGLAAGSRGYLGPVSTALVTGAAAGAAALGVAAMRADGTR